MRRPILFITVMLILTGCTEKKFPETSPQEIRDILYMDDENLVKSKANSFKSIIKNQQIGTVMYWLNSSYEPNLHQIMIIYSEIEGGVKVDKVLVKKADRKMCVIQLNADLILEELCYKQYYARYVRLVSNRGSIFLFDDYIPEVKLFEIEL